MESKPLTADAGNRRTRRIALGIGLGVVVLLLVMASALLYVRDTLYRPLPIAETQLFEIRAGSPFTVVAQELEASGVIENAGLLSLYARVGGLVNSIQAGEYELLPGMNTADLLAKITSGDVIQHRVTLVEGWTLEQVLAAVQGHEAIKVTLADVSAGQLAGLLELDAPSAEGTVHPETYFFARNTSDLELLRRARARQQEILQQLWAKRQGALPYQSPYQALVMASIIEKESGVSSEKAQIAGVFVRRLEQNMRLQSDPTVIYGLGSGFDGNLTRANLRQQTAYNTYRINGLPPTPIAIPGEEAIHAALNPAAGDALYFVATGEGGHQFSATLEEHNAAVNRYQRARIQGRADQ